MTDITKCNGVDCPVRDKCYRFTAKDGIWQSYLFSPPFEIIDGKFTCDMYWGEGAEGIWKQLNDIMK